jgi:hypothetical protein
MSIYRKEKLMAATVSIKECNGTGPTATTVTALRFCTTDVYNPGTNYPLVKPGTGSTNYSYKKSLYLNADTTPTGTINNVKFYSDGNIGWTGVTIQAKTSATYSQATGTQGTTGAQMTGGASVASHTSAAPLSVNGTLSNPSTGKISDYVELQAVISDTAVAGTLSSETLTFQYDVT